MRIKDLPRVDRPREKLEKYGPSRLSNSELLAILLGTGQKDVNVVELSSRILKKFSGSGLTNATFHELKNTYGLGSAKACEVVACFELGRRLLKEGTENTIISPQEVWSLLKDVRNNRKEHFVVFYLDPKSKEISREVVSIGSLNNSLVHPREIFEPAVKHLAAYVIIAHNHPSGDLTPSEEDLEITKDLAIAGKILGINLVDHVIVSKEGYLSFREKGLIEGADI